MSTADPAVTAVFIPIVDVKPTDDGRIKIQFDWSGAFFALYASEGREAAVTVENEKFLDRMSAALDEWIATVPKTFFHTPKEG